MRTPPAPWIFSLPAAQEPSLGSASAGGRPLQSLQERLLELGVQLRPLCPCHLCSVEPVPAEVMLSLAVADPGWVFRAATSALQSVQQIPGTVMAANQNLSVLDKYTYAASRNVSYFCSPPLFALFFN